jgi:mxaL protein
LRSFLRIAAGRWAWLGRIPGISRQDLPIVAALLLFVAAVWMPPLTLQRPTFSYLVTFDVTQSMEVEDADGAGLPVSRLAAARTAMSEVLGQLPCGSRVGWAVFADYRTLPLMLPVEVCAHYDDLMASLARIDSRMRWANASNIGKGATWALRSARSIDDSTRVLFFTDGHESPPLRPGESPPMGDITPGEVGGWLIGVGGPLAQRIPRTDREGRSAGFWAAEDVVQRPDLAAGQSREHLSELREEHLGALAKLLGLGYRRLTDTPALLKALRDPAMAQAQPVETDLRALPALLALALLAWRFLPGRAVPAGRR